ncbi:MAG: hypothetical protein LBH41_02830, partial [Rickettsiales bacterium]|nr:hypothetical protein [Rickettsiales bacterium]
MRSAPPRFNARPGRLLLTAIPVSVSLFLLLPAHIFPEDFSVADTALIPLALLTVAVPPVAIRRLLPALILTEDDPVEETALITKAYFS